MLIILVVIYYIFLRYSPEQIITYSGYAIEGKEMVENLKSSDKSKLVPYLGLIAVQENDLLYKRLNSYYVGEDDKKEIDINYPIYINEGNALLNLGENTKLITVNYEEVEGYPDFMMVDGVMYNGADITRADGNKYLFLKSEDGIYTNVEPITITTANGEYTIKEFSNIYFAEDHIAYYEMEGIRGSEENNNDQDENSSTNADQSNGTNNNKSNKQNDNLKDSYLAYKEINPIDPDSKTKLNGETITYKTLLERLEILQTEESNNEVNSETENTMANETKEDDAEENKENKENTVIEETTEYNNSVTNQTIINMENNDNEEDEWQEGMWEKPEVSCTDFETGVYSATTNLSVRDRAGMISRGVMFELYLDGRLNRRVLATQTGNIEISNLQPSSEYEIKGIFYYTNEDGIEQQEEFYSGKATTQSIDTLGTIDFSFQNGEIYSNKIELKNLKINNNIDEEVIKGISRLQVEIGDIAYRLSNNQVNDIKAGKEITYQTSESLTSNSKIKYKITAFDRFGNELKEQNNEGETITSKQIPRASIRPTKQDVTEIEIEVTLNNKDNVKLENYRYEITNQIGDIVKQGILGNGNGSNNGQASEDGSFVAGGNINDGHKETLKFNDLDPNGYYQIVIYGDYNLEDGAGIKENAELGRGSFVTRPLASLGYMQVKIDDKEITQNSMKLGISIDENQTDARLLAILDKVEVVIYDQGKNVEDTGNNEGNENNGDSNSNNESNEDSSSKANSIENTDKQDENDENNSNNNDSNNQGDNNNNNENNQEQLEQEETEVQRITFTQEQVEKLKTAEEVELNIEKLNSNTKYRIDVITTVKQGTVEEVVEDKQNIEQLITLKMPAEVQIKNQFVIGTMIDLDMRIEDIDNAVLINKVRIEVRDKDNKLIDLSEMQTNAEYERKTYEDLTPNEEYRIIVYAPQYNIGNTDATYEADYVLKEIKIVTETGISGKLDLIGLEKTPTGKNLIDASSKVNWYEKCFNNNENYYGLTYEKESNIIILGGSNSPHNSDTYYDLSKFIGKELTISFKAKSSNSKNLSIIEKTNAEFSNSSATTYYKITDLTDKWKEYSYTVKSSQTGYIGFHIENNNVTVEMQDIQIELGNKKTDYEEFKYNYNANVVVTVNDERDEITTNDYYIRVYKNNEQIQELRYEEIGEDNKVENIEKTYNIDPDANYKIELLVKIGERYYKLDSQEFTTEGSKELKGIFNKNDFLKIQPYGEYIILNDIDIRGGWILFGNNIPFDGKINFNGNSLISETLYDVDGVFYTLDKNSLIENLVFDIRLNSEKGIAMAGGFARYNYGTIKNIKINLLESYVKENSETSLFVHANYGTIENFIINCEKSFSIYYFGSTLCAYNRGTIKNGYIYGENVKLLSNSQEVSSMFGEIAGMNQYNGIIKNIYSLVNVDRVYKESSETSGVFCYTVSENASVENVYSVGIGENANLNYGPNIYSKSSKKIYNNYYFADEIFTSELETKGNKLSLWDAEFQNQLINEDGVFTVDELVNEGYYPQLNMPDCMPVQEFIELPEVADSDLPDILSTKVLEQGTDSVKVEFSVNNPSAEQISDIEIEYIDVDILTQEYSNGKSTVIAELKNPEICVSNYEVISLSTRGAFGSSYTRPYEEGERVINVDLYKEIWNVNDWKKINDSPTENYMLMEDLNFINEENTIVLTNVHGIINGNEHSISNIKLTDNSSLIGSLYGTFENIYINNFDQTSISYGGVITTSYSGSLIDNVHINRASIVKSGDGILGGLVRYAQSCSIRNCSVNDLTIRTEGVQNQRYIGGLVGHTYSTNISNSYVYNIRIEDSKGVNSAVGGIVGNAKDGAVDIKNCYAEGIIISDNLNVGGIIGATYVINLENCYSKVNISTTNNKVGGIVGEFTGNDINTIVNNLSIGNIYTTSGINSLNRIVGSSSETVSNNYAYDKQLLNGYERVEEKGATLLSLQEVLELDFGDSYNYESNGTLPKLYNTQGTKLLPNQKDIYLSDSETTGINLEVENIEIEKPNTTEAEIAVKIKNPEEIEITGLEIEDMTVLDVTRNVTQNGITSITVRATPNRYYDSYKLAGIKYKAVNKEDTGENQSSQQNTKEVEIEIPVQFYKEIYTYEDWQSIEEGTYQNYKLMSDIDFNGKANIKNNITVNRLESDNDIHYLKNINLEYNIANTGLINNVKTSIKNIGFENITLTNTGKSSNYFGVIASNNGEIQNLDFNKINIEAVNMSYVGAIGGMTSGNINEIKLTDVNVNGYSHVGAGLGYIDIRTNAGIKNITGTSIEVIGKSQYVGGLIGYQYGEYINCNNLSIENAEISGGNYTGGICGRTYRGQSYYYYANDIEVSGKTYTGGICGVFANGSGDFNKYYMTIENSKINGSGSDVGGICGYVESGNKQYWSVYNSNIKNISANAKRTGGLFGASSWIPLYYFEVVETNIEGLGSEIGGAFGGNENVSSGSSVSYGIIENCSVKGDTNVGGIGGSSSYSTIAYVSVNANITGNSNVGGVIGYMDNENMTASRYMILMREILILDSNIKAKTKVGGMVGDIAKELLKDGTYNYNNYIDADLITEDIATSSLIIGGRQEENPYITNTYVYKYSKINDNYVYVTNDNIDNSQYLLRTDLNSQNTYSSKIGIGTTYWNYASLTEGKYPKIKDSYLYYPELQEGVNLPVDPEVADISLLNENNDKNGNENNTITQNDIQNSIETENTVTLPNYKAYPISVNEINVDFNKMTNEYNAGVNGDSASFQSETKLMINEVNTKEETNKQQLEQNSSASTTFTYYIDGQEQETVELSNSTNQTYTFKYDFKDTIEIKLNDEQEEKTITITPEDVRSEASLTSENNAYLLGTNLYINGELQQGEYVNVYEGYALRSNGTVMNIATGEIVENTGAKSSNNANSSQTYLEQDKETYLEQTPKPLHTYEYKGNTIEVYGTYSKINGNIKLQIYNVRSGKLSALSNSLDMKVGNSITDNYNNKEYQTILNTKGELIDLKEKLQYPENFLARNIKQIVQNTDEEKPEVMVLYNTGKAIVFNYVTGEVVYENNEKADNGLTDYLAGSIENIWDDYEEKQQEYAKSKELEQKLVELPVEKAIERVNGNNLNSNNSSSLIDANNTNGNITDESTANLNNNYITIYNAETEKYEVYSEEEILNESEEEPVSETEKIRQNGLEGIYGYNAKEEIKPQTNGGVIVIAIIAVAIIALVILRRVIIKNNIKKKK